MMRWVDGRPRWWYGWADLGPIQIMPVPPFIILTDRADGTKWWVTFNTTTFSLDSLGYISISTTSPPINNPGNILTYGAFEEPWLTNGQDANGSLTRLIVRGGFLGVEVLVQGEPGHATGGPTGAVAQQGQHVTYALQANVGFNLPMRNIILSQTTPGQYAWVPVTITQTPNPQ